MKAKAPKLAVVSMKEDARWQAEDDMRTLTRAQEIQADRARMARVASIAKQQAMAATKVANMASRAKPTAKPAMKKAGK